MAAGGFILSLNNFEGTVSEAGLVTKCQAESHFWHSSHFWHCEPTWAHVWLRSPVLPALCEAGASKDCARNVRGVGGEASFDCGAWIYSSSVIVLRFRSAPSDGIETNVLRFSWIGRGTKLVSCEVEKELGLVSVHKAHGKGQEPSSRERSRQHVLGRFSRESCYIFLDGISQREVFG